MLQPIFEAGQVWKYQNRPGEDDSTITILKIEPHGEDAIVHICVDDLKMANAKTPGEYNHHIGHLPFAQKVLRDCVTALVGQSNSLPDLEGYTVWKAAFDKRKAGFFTITVSEAVDAIASMLAG